MTTSFQQNAMGAARGPSPLDPNEMSASIESIGGGQLPAALTHLTGRDTEVGLLMDRWDQAQEGMGQVVLIVGEPGLGKSRLVHTIKEHVRHADSADSSATNEAAPEGVSHIVEWRCSQVFQNTELHPAADYFERFLGFDRLETASQRFDGLAQSLDELELGQPEMVALFAKLLFLPSDDRYPKLGLTPLREREETFRALRQWLHASSLERPILFIVEDLHWLDASTLEFLGQFIAEGLHDRVLTVLTFRPEFKTPWPAVAHQSSLALNRLTRRQVAELMRAETAVSVPDSMVQQIYQRTRGVPLLVEEFTRLIREPLSTEPAAKESVPHREAMPATLQELVLTRLERLSSNREVVHLAATIGREFHYEMLAAVVTVDEGLLQEELAKLVRAEILHPIGPAPHCVYQFKHALLEEALGNALEESERSEFHGRVAETMEKRFPKVAQTQPELLARHFAEAGNIEKAVAYLAKAGLRSSDRFANVEAIYHFEQGLKLLVSVKPSPERDVRELELLRPLGTAYIASRGYAAPEVGPIFGRARKLCERVGDQEQLFAIMWGNFAFHIVRGDLRLCASLAEEALEFAQTAGDPGILMVAMFLVGLTRLYRGDFAGAHEFCELAIDRYDDRERTRLWAARTGEDAGVTLRCYLALALWHLGFPDQALRLSEEVCALARDIDQPFSIEYSLHHTAWLRQHCRLGPQTQAAGEEQIRIAQEQGFPFWQASGTIYKGAGILLQTRLEDGLRLLRKGLEAYRSTGAELALPYYLGLLGESLTRATTYEEARRVLDEGLVLVEKNDDRFYEAELHRLRGELLLAEGSAELGGAEACFQKALEIARRQQSRALELRATMSLARLRHGQRRKDAYALLAGVYHSFDEGLGAPDLIEAAALMETFGNERMRDDFAAGVKYVRDCLPAPMEGAVSVDWRYIPASTLGGDTLGYHWIDEDHLAIYLIDVTGHGLDSALLAVTITTVVRSGSLPETDMRQPSQVLGKLNKAFQGRLHGYKFFSIWYGVYSPGSRILSWSGGGHPPSLLLSPGSSQPQVLSSTGPLMGVLPAAEFATRLCVVAEGSHLLVFSDGAFEIIRDREMVWNLSDCIDYLAALNLRGESLMEGLLTHVRSLHGSLQLDDDFSIIEATFP